MPPADHAGPSPANPLLRFAGGLEPVPVTAAYRLALLLVAVAMLLLPLVYLALVAGAAWAVWWYAIHGAGIFLHARHVNLRVVLLAYCGPLAIGAVIVLFMIKPLFARAGADPAVVRLDAPREPTLFAFVRRICALVGAPEPREIRVDCHVNASAGFRRGWRSFLGHDLVLTIGLPLAAGLDARQLAGVLAHEFGHFAQGSGMRLTYVVRSINGWFARVVHQRDAWDDRLLAWQRSGGWSALVFGLARALVWATRRVLWALMLAGHAISCAASRQMELDADRYEARLVGAEVFAATAERIRLLSVADHGAYVDLRASWRERRLGDDFAALVEANVRQVPAELRERLELAAAGGATGWLDTHPCDRERAANARRETAPAAYRAEGSATALFADFAALSREATLAHYRELIGPEVTAKNLVATGAIVGEVDARAADDAAAHRWFGGVIGATNAVLAGDDDGRPPRERLAGARAALAASADAPRLAADYRRADDGWLAAARALSLAQAEVPFTPGEFGLASTRPAEARTARERRAAERDRAAAALAPAADAARARARAALDLLATGEVDAGLPQAEALRAEAAGLRACAAALDAVARPLDEARREFLVVTAVIERTSGEPSDRQQAQVVSGINGLFPRLTAIKAALGGARYPFAHADGEVDLERWAVPALPRRDDYAGALSAAQQALEKLYGLRGRVLGRLAAIGEAVERAAGLEPIAGEPAKRSA